MCIASCVFFGAPCCDKSGWGNVVGPELDGRPLLEMRRGGWVARFGDKSDGGDDKV